MNAIIKQNTNGYYVIIETFGGNTIEWQETYQTKAQAVARAKALGYTFPN